MRALRQRFDTPPECGKLSQELARAHEELHSRLDGRGQKLLLRLTDFENAMRDRASLHGFTNDYLLAGGIDRELSNRSPCSFDRGKEERAGGAERGGTSCVKKSAGLRPCKKKYFNAGSILSYMDTQHMESTNIYFGHINSSRTN